MRYYFVSEETGESFPIDVEPVNYKATPNAINWREPQLNRKARRAANSKQES